MPLSAASRQSFAIASLQRLNERYAKTNSMPSRRAGVCRDFSQRRNGAKERTEVQSSGGLGGRTADVEYARGPVQTAAGRRRYGGCVTRPLLLRTGSGWFDCREHRSLDRSDE